MKPYDLRGLYLVTPDWDDTDRLLAATEAALTGGAALTVRTDALPGTSGGLTLGWCADRCFAFPAGASEEEG